MNEKMSEELFIHQYKFSDWMPSSIHSITVDKYSSIIAIGRQDGEIEVKIKTIFKTIYFNFNLF